MSIETDQVKDKTVDQPTTADNPDLFADSRNALKPDMKADAAANANLPQMEVVDGDKSVYTVKSGDSLWKIAAGTLQDRAAEGAQVSNTDIANFVNEIYAANQGDGKNQIKSPNKIYPGQEFVIPGQAKAKDNDEAKPEEAKPEPGKDDKKQEEQKAEDPKPADTKPAEVAVEDSKPVDTKPAEVAVEDPKPVDTKPVEVAVEDPKPIDTKPAAVVDFSLPTNTEANPTDGAQAITAQTDTLKRLYSDIAGQDAQYLTKENLDQYLANNGFNLSDTDRQALEGVKNRFDRYQRASDDEWKMPWNNDSSGITLKDIDKYREQELSYEKQFVAQDYARKNFDQIAQSRDGMDPTITDWGIDQYKTKRASAGASPQELAVIDDLKKLYTTDNVMPKIMGVSKEGIDGGLAPMVDQRFYAEKG
ncbi:MAG: LysM peptidoglycan-binding domain-containing protein [Candidatus Melainabacteria bacterium]|nr:LysM peptidoglycan-binding domain-containing protein [Candidatus Melainabacteria bacterium]